MYTSCVPTDCCRSARGVPPDLTQAEGIVTRMGRDAFLRLGKRKRIERGPRLRGFAEPALACWRLDVQLSDMTTINYMDGTR